MINSDLKVLKREQLRNCIGVVVGTRPGIIKFSPVIRNLKKREMDYFVMHTGQHYSYNMDRQFFRELEFPEPEYTNDNVRHCLTHGTQTAEMIKGVEKALIKECPKIVIVGGDANTNLAGALAARKLGISLAHMEAGLRSMDWRMPEEHNRIMIDHISDILFAPTETAKKNLIQDNVKGRIFVTGNTIVDAIHQNVDISLRNSTILKQLQLKKRKYFLITIHREENVDSKENLINILESLYKLGQQYNYHIVFPIHPRTKKRIKFFELEHLFSFRNLLLINPVGYLDFLSLLANALIVLTDSGGIQEECCILQIPCVTLRDNTERPETLKVSANIIATTQPSRILEAVKASLDKIDKSWPNPFGDGKASQKIVSVLREELEKK